MKICSKCETIAIGDNATQCPDCGVTLSGYRKDLQTLVVKK